MNDPSLLIEHALTEGECLAFLDRFTGLNPHWKGARVADVLAVLDDTDSHCGDIEQVVDHFKPTDTVESALYRMASYAVLYSAHGETVASPVGLRDLDAPGNRNRIQALVAKAQGQP